MGLVESVRKQLIFLEDSGFGMWCFYIWPEPYDSLFSASCLWMDAGYLGARGGHQHMQLSARLTAQRCH